MRNLRFYLMLAVVIMLSTFTSVSFGQNKIVEGDIFPGIRYDKNYVINSEFEKSKTLGVSSTMTSVNLTSATANIISGLYSVEITAGNPSQTFTVSSTALPVGLNSQTCEGSFSYRFNSLSVPFYASVVSGSTEIASATLTNITGSTSATIRHWMTYACADGIKPSLRITSTSSSSTKLYADKFFTGVYIPQYAVLALSGTAIDWKSSNSFTKTLGANTTFTFTNAVAGQNIVVRLTNTASNYTVTWPTARWNGGAAPTMTPGAKTDTCTFFYDGSNYYGSCIQDMY